MAMFWNYTILDLNLIYKKIKNTVIFEIHSEARSTTGFLRVFEG